MADSPETKKDIPLSTVPPVNPEDDTKPKRPRAKRGGAKTKWAAAPAIEAALNSYFSGIGMVVTMIDPVDGEIIADGSEAVIKELIALGRVDKNFRKLLERLATPGKYGPLLIACSPIVIGIAANHNLLPEFKFFNKTKLEVAK